VVKIRVVLTSHIIIQPQLGLAQLAGIAVLAVGDAQTGADFAEGRVLDLAFEGTVRVCGDRSGTQVVAQDPVERAIDAHGNRL
jgi:hypothetical protein